MVLLHRNPLDERLAKRAGTPGATHVSVHSSCAAASILAAKGQASALAEKLAGLSGLRHVGPEEWLVVDPSAEDLPLQRALAERVGTLGSVAGQAGGRVLFAIDGPASRAILAKCTAVDLHPDVFAIGRSTNAALAEIAVNLARTGEDRFEIAVMSTYAGWVFDEVMEMGREFGLTAGFAA